jgi:SpoVK/Ycf46/Vps4 family AAA+-type ATPase
MATGDQLVAMLAAYRDGDRDRFRGVAMQAIAGLRSEGDKARAKDVLNSITNAPGAVAMRVLGTKDQGLVYALPAVDLDSLHLTDCLRAEVESLVAERSKCGELLDHKIPLRSRVLLHGPPGNGKTSLASAIATRAKLNGFGALLSQVRESYLGSTSANIHKAFQLADSGGSLLFLDEFDALAFGRTNTKDSSGNEQNATVSSLLQLLDRRPLGMVVAATNRLDIIDPAIMRRFDAVIEVPGPSKQAALAFAKAIFRRHEWELGDWFPPDVTSFAAVERDAMGHIRKCIMEAE